jgi:Ras-related protein Rab-7A
MSSDEEDSFYRRGEVFSPDVDSHSPPTYDPPFELKSKDFDLELPSRTSLLFEPVARRTYSDDSDSEYTPRTTTTISSLSLFEPVDRRDEPTSYDDSEYTPRTTAISSSSLFEPVDRRDEPTSYDDSEYTPRTTTTISSLSLFEPVGRRDEPTSYDDSEYTPRTTTTISSLSLFEPVDRRDEPTSFDDIEYTPRTTAISSSSLFEPVGRKLDESDEENYRPTGRSSLWLQLETPSKTYEDELSDPSRDYYDKQYESGERDYFSKTLGQSLLFGTPSSRKPQLYDDEEVTGLDDDARLQLAMNMSKEASYFNDKDYDDDNNNYNANNNNYNANNKNRRPSALKIIFLGNFGVGKSSIVDVFVSAMAISEGRQVATFKEVDGRTIKVVAHDTFSEERDGIDAVDPRFYADADGVVLVFDVNNATSFGDIDKWYGRATLYCNPKKVPFLLLGNKIDIEDKRTVSQKRAQNWCQANNNIPYFETSTKLKINIAQAMENIVHYAYYQKLGYDYERVPPLIPSSTTTTTTTTTKDTSKTGGSNKKTTPPLLSTIAGLPVATQNTLLSETETKAKEYIKDIKITKTDLELSKGAALNIAFQNVKPLHTALTSATKEALMLLSHGYSSRLDQLLQAIFGRDVMKAYAEAIQDSDMRVKGNTPHELLEKSPEFGLVANMAVAARVATFVDCLLIQFGSTDADRDVVQDLFATISDMYELCYAPWHLDSVTCSWIYVYNAWRTREIQYKARYGIATGSFDKVHERVDLSRVLLSGMIKRFAETTSRITRTAVAALETAQGNAHSKGLSIRKVEIIEAFRNALKNHYSDFYVPGPDCQHTSQTRSPLLLFYMAITDPSLTTDDGYDLAGQAQGVVHQWLEALWLPFYIHTVDDRSKAIRRTTIAKADDTNVGEALGAEDIAEQLVWYCLTVPMLVDTNTDNYNRETHELLVKRRIKSLLKIFPHKPLIREDILKKLRADVTAAAASQSAGVLNELFKSFLPKYAGVPTKKAATNSKDISKAHLLVNILKTQVERSPRKNSPWLTGAVNLMGSIGKLEKQYLEDEAKETPLGRPINSPASYLTLETNELKLQRSTPRTPVTKKNKPGKVPLVFAQVLFTSCKHEFIKSAELGRTITEAVLFEMTGTYQRDIDESIGRALTNTIALKFNLHPMWYRIDFCNIVTFQYPLLAFVLLVALCNKIISSKDIRQYITDKATLGLLSDVMLEELRDVITRKSYLDEQAKAIEDAFKNKKKATTPPSSDEDDISEGSAKRIVQVRTVQIYDSGALTTELANLRTSVIKGDGEGIKGTGLRLEEMLVTKQSEYLTTPNAKHDAHIELMAIRQLLMEGNNPTTDKPGAHIILTGLITKIGGDEGDDRSTSIIATTPTVKTMGTRRAPGIVSTSTLSSLFNTKAT